jgi:drug/metabolite transporter (DMT)-like permease
MPKNIWAHIALLSVALIYGANFIIAKCVMPNPIQPTSFIALRVMGATVLFWITLRLSSGGASKIVVPKREDWWRFLLCAIAGVATNQLLFFNGLALTSPVNASIIMTSNPILVMVMSALLLRQRITWIKVIGVALGAAGAITLLWLSNQDVSRTSSLKGDVFILLNSISYAFYLVMVKPLMQKYRPLDIVAWTFLIAIALVFPFGGMGLKAVDWVSLDSWQWFCVGFVIVCTTFLTYLFNILAIHRLSPTIASSYIYLQPVFAGVFALLLASVSDRDYSRDFSVMKIFCAAFIVLGVYLVSRPDQAVQRSAD